MSEWSSEVKRIVCVRGVWLRASAVDAVEAAWSNRRKAQVYLRGGGIIAIPEPDMGATDPVQSVVDALWGGAR